MYRAFQAIRYRGPTRLVPPAKDIRLLGKFQKNSDAAGSDLNTSCKSRLVPTYILPAREVLLGKFQPDSFKTERLVCVETDGQTTDGQG